MALCPPNSAFATSSAMLVLLCLCVPMPTRLCRPLCPLLLFGQLPRPPLPSPHIARRCFPFRLGPLSQIICRRPLHWPFPRGRVLLVGGSSGLNAHLMAGLHSCSGASSSNLCFCWCPGEEAAMAREQPARTRALPRHPFAHFIASSIFPSIFADFRKLQKKGMSSTIRWTGASSPTTLWPAGRGRREERWEFVAQNGQLTYLNENTKTEQEAVETFPMTTCEYFVALRPAGKPNVLLGSARTISQAKPN